MNYGFGRISKPRSKDKGAVKRLKQQDLETQRNAINTFVSSVGTKIDKWIFHEGSATKSLQKRGVTTLLNTLKPGDKIFVVSLDRLARSVTELHTIVNGILRAGAGLMVIDCPAVSFEPGDEALSPIGSLLVSMLGAVSQFELSLFSSRIKRGIAHKKAAEPDWKPGPTDEVRAQVAARKTVAAKERAESLRPIFEKLIRLGKSERQIADHLNRKKILTPRGSQWYQASVQRTLKHLGLKTKKS